MKRKSVLVAIGLTGAILASSLVMNYRHVLTIETMQTYLDAMTDKNATLQQANKELRDDVSALRETISCNKEAYNENLQNMYEQLQIALAQTSYEEGFGELSYEDIILLAKVMQMEAGEGNYESQMAIATVILNRVNNAKFPNTIREVVYQRSKNAIQFAVAYDGALERCQLKPETIIVACKVLTEKLNYPENLLFFCAESIDFSSYANYYKTIEGTRFYTL